MKWIKKLLLIGGIIVGIGAAHLAYLFTHRTFGPADFAFPFFFEKNRYSAPSQELKQDVKGILRQKFFHLGYGKQMTCYESEDHQYILKFFNPRPVIRDKWMTDFQKIRHLSSLRWVSHMYLKKKQRLFKLADRYNLVYQKDPALAGLIYLHLDAGSQLQGTVNLCDEKGKAHCVNIAQRPFVLQRKGELVASRFARLKQEGNSKQIEDELEQLFALFLKRASLGLTDRIQTLHNNYAFAGGNPIQIDLGRLHEDPTLNPQEEALRAWKCAGSRLCKRDASFKAVYEAVLQKHSECATN